MPRSHRLFLLVAVGVWRLRLSDYASRCTGRPGVSPGVPVIDPEILPQNGPEIPQTLDTKRRW